MKCGLLGRRLGHSYSPQIHGSLGDYPYVLFEKEPEEIADFLKNGDFTGINVTIPYKKEVIPFLDDLSPIARKLGAVNTVVRRRDGTLLGHNTDCYGFSAMVRRSGLSVSGKKVLVLGSGGASNTAVAVLEELEAQVTVVSRTGENNYQNLFRHADAAVIVNTTPLGMYPDTDAAPVDLDCFPRLEGVLDVIYNPARTALLQQAEKRGIVSMNGLLMLVAQAKEAAEWFTEEKIADSVVDEIHRGLAEQMQNIILVGMPGCGKSTIGKALAQRTGRIFLDADDEIEKMAKKSIPQIFAEDGEDVFRTLETRVLAELGKQSGLVIATGGGCVTREQNYPLLHQNGTIFWLKRELSLLPTEGRPLSQRNKLEDMWKIRRPMYEAFADHTVENNQNAEAVIGAILAKLEDTA